MSAYFAPSSRHFAGKFHILLNSRKSESTAFVESLNPQGSTGNVEEPNFFGNLILLETSHDRDEINFDSEQGALIAGGLEALRGQRNAARTQNMAILLMGGFQKRPLVILFQLLKFESRYS